MMNFILGTVAGALLAALLTIVAVRQPEVQSRLGLFPMSTTPILPAARPPDPAAESRAKSLAACPTGQAEVGKADMLFNRKRFWLVTP